MTFTFLLRFSEEKIYHYSGWRVIKESSGVYKIKKADVTSAFLNLLSDSILMFFHLKQKVFYGLLPCGWLKLRDHLLFACVCENRVHFCDDDYAAETFFS